MLGQQIDNGFVDKFPDPLRVPACQNFLGKKLLGDLLICQKRCMAHAGDAEQQFLACHPISSVSVDFCIRVATQRLSSGAQ
jgi:hypothetical protein